MSPGSSRQDGHRSTLLKLFRPESASTPSGGGEMHWTIYGHKMTVVIWSPEEWARLDDKPPDSQLYPGGSRAAVRIE